MMSVPLPFRRRVRRTLMILILPAVIVAPPLIFPPLRTAYAPAHDTVVLWILGNVWYRGYPVSAMFLLPAAVLLTGLGVAWLFHVRFIHRVQLAVTTAVIRRFPRRGPYHALKRMHLIVIAFFARRPDGWRGTFPWNRIPARYDATAPSGCYLRVANYLCARWTEAARHAKEEREAVRLMQRAASVHAGLARLYVPALSGIAVIDERNLALAVRHLDEAQLSGQCHWPLIRKLFAVYAGRHGIETTEDGEFALSHVHRALEGEHPIEKTILLRVLINLWFETGRPSVASMVTGFISRYLDRADQTFSALIEAPHVPFDVSVLPPLAAEPPALSSFQRRYLHFAEQARGPAYAISTRGLIEDVGRKAEHVLHLLQSASPGERIGGIDAGTLERIGGMARACKRLMTTADFYEQALSWRAVRGKLRHLSPVATRSLWTAMYRAGHLHATGRKA